MNQGTLELQKILEFFKTMTVDEYKKLYLAAQRAILPSDYVINTQDIVSSVTYSIDKHTASGSVLQNQEAANLYPDFKQTMYVSVYSAADNSAMAA